MKIFLQLIFYCAFFANLSSCSSSTYLVTKNRNPSSIQKSFKEKCTSVIKSIFRKTNRTRVNQSFEIKKTETSTPLQKDEFPNIRQYISSSYINKKMRGAAPLSDEDQAYIFDLSSELRKQPNFEGKVTRATKIDFDFENMYRPGSIIKETAFTSASIGEGAGLMGDTIFYDILFLIESRTAKDITKLNPTEREVIFLPGTEFSVTKVQGSLKFNDIAMNENLSEFRYNGDDTDYLDTIAYSRSLKKLEQYSEYFKQINVNKIKEKVQEEFEWVLDEWDMEISDIKTIEDLIKIGFDPVIEIHMKETGNFSNQ